MSAMASDQTETEITLSTLKEGYPAVALINALLQHYAMDFHRYNRNVHTSKGLWNEWNMLYESILSHMEAVQKEDGNYQSQWDSFMKYTAAIDPFEEYLLDLEADLSVNEVSPIPPTDGVAATITFMGSWALNRKRFIDAGQLLKSPHYTALTPTPRDTETVLRRVLRNDDLQVLNDLTTKISTHSLEDDDILDDAEELVLYVTDVKNDVQAASEKAKELADTEHERMGQIVYAMMAIYIPFIAHDKDVDNAHVVSKDVWTAVKKFANETLKFSEGTSVTLDTFKAQWIAYEIVLNGKLNAFAGQMISLMRHASQVRRPFFGRTVGIVRMWEELTTSTAFQKEEKATARKQLIQLLNDTMKQFGNTSKAIQTFADENDLDKTIEKTKTEYSALTVRLQAELDTYAPGKWEKIYKDYTAGATVDDLHLNKFRAFVEKNARAATLKAT